MDFLDRLRVLMDENGDNNSTLAKKSGIPYTTIDGLFKRGWEKAQISTIQKICSHYNVTLDYMVYGAKGLSDESTMIAGKYDTLTDAGKEFINAAVSVAVKTFAKREEGRKRGAGSLDVPLPRIGTVNGVPLFQLPDDRRLPMKEAALEELKELTADAEPVTAE